MFQTRKKQTSKTVASKSSSRNKINKKQSQHQYIFNTIGESSLKHPKSKSQIISKQPLSHPKSSQISQGTNSSQYLRKKNSLNAKKSIDKYKYIESQPNQQQKKKTKIFYKQSQTEKAQVKWVNKYPSNGRSIQKQKLQWDQKTIPYEWQTIVQNYKHYLTKYQLSQIKQFNKIFYIGHKAKKRQKIQYYESGFDNEDKQYNYIQKDHIGYRYQIISLVGKGSYGQVFRVYDHKRKQQMALKMIRNKSKFSKQSFIQIKILTYIKQNDCEGLSNIVRIKDFIIFRKHVCLVFQLLSENLYELIIRNNYNGLNIDLIRRFAIQILSALCFLEKHKIIHCDLKPQNILLREYSKSGIKIIDFGSSCFQNQIIYTYIQSRYYRAPQVTLGIQYNTKIDIWSAGCILGELFTGVPLFPGENQNDQMKYVVNTLGVPPKELLLKATRSDHFFTPQFALKTHIAQLPTIDHFSRPLQSRITDPDFRQFLLSFLKWDPKQRTTATEALKSPWILSGLPEELRKLNLSTNQTYVYNKKKSKSKSLQKTSKNSQIKIFKLKKN